MAAAASGIGRLTTLLGAAARGAGRGLGAAAKGVGRAVVKSPRYARLGARRFVKSIPKGAWNKTKFFGGKALGTAGTGWMLYDMGHAMLGSNELSADQKALLQEELLNALGADPLGVDLYQQQLMASELNREVAARLNNRMSPEDMRSRVRGAELTRMLQDHEEALMKNALTESQLQQSSAFAPNYSELANSLDRRYRQ
jgi:hypothetical protein